MSRSRAIRRHHKKRIKERAKRRARDYVRRVHGIAAAHNGGVEAFETLMENIYTKIADNPKKCDGYCCKNLRHFDGQGEGELTIPEKQAEQELRDYLGDSES
jgi:hypothetical protein